MKFVILAAGKSKRIYQHIKTHKCLIEIKNNTIIEDTINKIKLIKGVDESDIFIVVGFLKKKIKDKLSKYSKINYIQNNFYNNSEMSFSLLLGLNNIKDEAIILYSDIIYSYETLNRLMGSRSKNITMPILKNWKNIWKLKNSNFKSDAEDLKINLNNEIISIGNKIKNINKVKYQYMGILYLPYSIISSFKNYLKLNKNQQLTQILNLMIKDGYKIKTIPINTYWYEIDDLNDLRNLKKNYFKIFKESFFLV